MAKKVTIPTSNPLPNPSTIPTSLQSLSDAWGGVNNTGETITVNGKDVPDGAEWGMNRGEVEKFLKSELAKRATVLKVYTSNNYAYIIGFKDEADYDTWDDAGNSLTSELLLFCERIPIAVNTTVQFAARIDTDVDPDDTIVAIKQSYKIGVTFNATRTDAGGSEDLTVNGTLQIFRRTTSNDDWPTVPVATMRLASVATGSTDYTTVDIGKYFIPNNDTQQIALRVVYTETDDEDNVVNVTSRRVVFTSIIHTSLSLQWAGSVTTPVASGGNSVTLQYNLSGTVKRLLHVIVTNGTTTSTYDYPIAANAYTSYSEEWSQAFYSNIFGATGIKTITAYLIAVQDDGSTPYEDDEGNDLVSATVVTQLLVLDSSDTSDTPYLLLQNLVTTAENYIQLDVCQFAVVRPNGDTTPTGVSFAVDNLAAGNGSSIYARASYEVASGLGNDTVYLHNLPMTIEIETEASNTPSAVYFHAYIDGVATDWAHGALITVSTAENYAPTSGAAFVFNPKQVTGNTYNIVESEDGQRVLRVAAGKTVTFNTDWLLPFKTSKTAAVTLELDLKMRNVTNEDDPIIQAFETVGSTFYGLKLAPLVGVIRCKDKSEDALQNFFIQEDERTHIAINIITNYIPDQDYSSCRISLCRVFINGVINREFTFNVADDCWYSQGSSIIIGQEGSDVDIYGIRLYHKTMSETDVRQDYLSTLPTGAEKVKFKQANASIIKNNRVDLEQCKAAGLNVLVWHGDLPRNNGGTPPQGQQVAPVDAKGWWEIHIYNDSGAELLEYSGQIGKTYDENNQIVGRCKATRQGTTANTYYYSNLQTKLKSLSDSFEEEVAAAWVASGLGTAEQAAEKKAKVMAAELPYTATGSSTGTGACPTGLWVKLTEIHTDFTDYNENENREDYAFVPCGWIDGNGLYRGPQYKMQSGVPYATKLVAKINYASSMQSHLGGSCNIYNDLQKAVVGNAGTMREGTQARTSKPLLPFLLFAGDPGQELYNGPTTFGPGKMDDPTWGYNKKNTNHALFCMMEGADNNRPLTDFRVPYHNVEYHYDGQEVDGLSYNGYDNVNFDLDRFKASSQTIGGVEYEVPSSGLIAKIKEFVNTIYYYNPRIRPYVGNFNQLNADASIDKTYKYWCTADMKLRRYDYVDAGNGSPGWVDAGWDATNNITTVLRLTDIDASLTTTNYPPTGDNYDRLNQALIYTLATQAKGENGIGAIVDVMSLRFHYAFVNQFLAGTDNCSKNTYYVYDPVQGKWQFHQDDMDTIFSTDNNAHLTKPYYIDRQHPYADEDTNHEDILYQGQANALFNLCEAMFEPIYDPTYRDSNNRTYNSQCTAIAEMMGMVLSAMSNLGPTGNTTPWGCLKKYFFSIQEYFPAIAYNEAARIRYEYPEVALLPGGGQGFVTERGVHPISQSLGNLLEGELQYMKRRLVLFASYAKWGNFGSGTASAGSLGLPDAAASFSVFPNTSGDVELKFEDLVPHQYIWPTAAAATSVISLGQRCKPGVPVDFTINATITGDDAFKLSGSNYYRSLGSTLGKLIHNGSEAVSITARRLVELAINPVGAVTMRATALVLSTPLIKTLDLSGESTIGGTLDLSGCLRLETVDLTGTSITNVILPSTDTLTSVALPATMTVISVYNCPALETLTVENYGAAVTSLSLKGCPLLDTYTLLTNLKSHGAELEHLAIDNLSWSSAVREVLMWAANIPGVTEGVEHAELTGSVTINSSANITLADKMALAQWYGNIDTNNPATGLKVNYTSVAITSLSIQADNFMWTVGNHQATAIATPASGNNVKLTTDAGGNVVPMIAWAIEDYEGNAATPLYASFSDAINGVITIAAHSSNDEATYYMKATLTKTDNSTVSARKRVLFYHRVPKVGDFAYCDGQFDEEFYSDRTVIGIVYMVTPVTVNGVVTSYTVRIVAMNDVMPTNYATHKFSIQQNQAPINSDADLQTAIRTAIGETSNYYIFVVRNMMDGGSSRGNATPQVMLTGAGGDWNWEPADSNYVTECFKGEDYTAKYIAHAEKLRTQYLNAGLTEADAAYVPKPTDLASFSSVIAQLRAKGTNCDGYIWPAAYACHIYQPTVANGTLCDAYKAGKWYLPCLGELARLCSYYMIGANSSYTSYQGTSDASRPIFVQANAKANSANKITWATDWRWSANQNGQNYAWYVNFSNGFVNSNYNRTNAGRVRPVVAFNFVL